ncbi:glycoside hydrolase [Reichenbachiella carrageenanivorans]|uniref:Glycoside hydrolase n=1 Tax=Reichenbachiella carrageenanivorans TaxID=2979869 RepID=A0ABY6D363_9BACT|nr:sialidase family protein [Reichenbachiella carrageenanivorans]UXX80601.1 glycoside hydrolase [Reichenbachiella carrageenanivorans]
MNQPRRYYLLLIFITYLSSCTNSINEDITPQNININGTVIIQADSTFYRNSEASLIKLMDSTFLLCYTAYENESDFSKATIRASYSHDNGITWSTPLNVLNDNYYRNLSPSLIRIDARNILMFFIRRISDDKTQICYIKSRDNGQNWSNNIRVISKEHLYHVVNNDRVIQLSNNDIIVPFAYTNSIENQYKNQSIKFYISSDLGETWALSENEISVSGPAMEPGIIEVNDGNLMAVIRTQLGTIYFAKSSNYGRRWEEAFDSGLYSPESPSSIYRIEETGQLILIWNNVKVNTASERILNVDARTPLSYSISEDNGESWSSPTHIENHAQSSFAYTSILEKDGELLLTYYYKSREATKFRSLVFNRLTISNL